MIHLVRRLPVSVRRALLAVSIIALAGGVVLLLR